MIWAIFRAPPHYVLEALRPDEIVPGRYEVLARLPATTLVGARRLCPRRGLEVWPAERGRSDGLVEAYRPVVVRVVEVAA